jgi:release factor-specific protein-(glutamine-N5) methyltransferase
VTFLELLSSLPNRERDDAVWLLSARRRCSRSEVLLAAREPIAPAELRKFRRDWARRRKGEPLQYIVKSAPFFGREFFVSRSVLIPRPETEVLVELTLQLVKEMPAARVLDVGTGSGCIALTLKAEAPGLAVLGTDISPGALAVARKNAKQLGVGVAFEKHDLISPSLRARAFDLVVSNPPYLEFGRDPIASDVKKWEPRAALEPLPSARVEATRDRASWCAQRILEACSELRPRYTALELSPRVAASLERKWKPHPSVRRIWREPDLAGRKRFLLIAWENPPAQQET